MGAGFPQPSILTFYTRKNAATFFVTANGGVYTVFPKYEGISRTYPVNTKNFNIMPEVGA